MIVKAGDTHSVEWKANLDLTGAIVRLTARKRAGDPIPLDCEVTDPGEGLVRHELTGTLPAGTYQIELEATMNGEIITFPNSGYAQLVVQEDLD